MNGSPSQQPVPKPAPRPEDFGLTGETVKAWKENRDRLERQRKSLWEKLFAIGGIFGILLIAYLELNPILTIAVWVMVLWFLRQPLGVSEADVPYVKFLNHRAEHQEYEKRRTLQWWNSLGGIGFEKEVAKIYQKKGFRVELTPATADGGADLIIHSGTEKIVAQCKAHQKPVGIGVARELAATRVDFGADQAYLIALSGATRPVHDYIRGKPMSLIDVNDLIRMSSED